ncbi:hypothetical protein CDAR_424821 [Caerostris darwini]|uniref:Uncharacterized protein n=1 Tax=Caerostris darwini TaxID=1538125 RepID=A0AAV4U1K4_9ARAC|nr:hypothetical protein CDAR_424821 [Caerostris darwini]
MLKQFRYKLISSPSLVKEEVEVTFTTPRRRPYRLVVLITGAGSMAGALSSWLFSETFSKRTHPPCVPSKKKYDTVSHAKEVHYYRKRHAFTRLGRYSEGLDRS